MKHRVNDKKLKERERISLPNNGKITQRGEHKKMLRSRWFGEERKTALGLPQDTAGGGKMCQESGRGQQERRERTLCSFFYSQD